jgi:hypothetical protein
MRVSLLTTVTPSQPEGDHGGDAAMTKHESAKDQCSSNPHPSMEDRVPAEDDRECYSIG